MVAATGLNVLIGGAPAIPGAVPGTEATVDNELRFFSVFWLAYGGFCFGSLGISSVSIVLFLLSHWPFLWAV